MMIVPEKLSLLDYFAGQALGGILSDGPVWDDSAKKSTEWRLLRCEHAYLYAKQMLETRQRYIMEEDE